MIGIAIGLGRSQRGAGGGGGGAPANTGLPAISGTPTQGQTLTATDGTWTGSPAPVFTYQWRRNGTDIPGATGTTYMPAGADVGAALSVRVTATNAAGSAGATSPASPAIAQSLLTLSATPAARWHPQFSSVAASGGRVVSATDLQGLAGATEGGGGIGPRMMTDALGRGFWRFEGAEFLNVATTLAGLNNRAISVFLVGRVHRTVGTNAIFGIGNAAAGTAVNTANATLDVAIASNSAPFLRSHSRAGSLDPANKMWMVPGTQMQVLGAVSRTTANGATRLWVNNRAADVTQNTIAASGVNGAEIGRNPFNPGTSGNWGLFDLYELVVYNAGLTNAEGDAVAAALVSHYGIPAVTNQLVLEGDSITQGTGTVSSGSASGMIVTEPGTNRIPAGWRVVNMGVSGAQVSNLTTRRDATDGWASLTLAGGQNIVAFEIGRNDMVTLTALQHYGNVVAWLNTAAVGVLQRGWTVRVLVNIATGGAVQTALASYRALLRNAQFLTDTGTGTGAPFDGRLSLVSADLIEDGAAGTIFETSGDALSATYYQGDNTHPTPAGALLRVTGGTTPAYGVAAGL